MARPKKPTYGFVASRGEYRKRIKGPDGRRISLYAKTPEELTEKIAAVQREIEEDVYHRDNPTVEEYATKWLAMHGSHVRGHPGRCEDGHRQGRSAVGLHLPGRADALQDDFRLGTGESHHR